MALIRNYFAHTVIGEGDTTVTSFKLNPNESQNRVFIASSVRVETGDGTAVGSCDVALFSSLESANYDLLFSDSNYGIVNCSGSGYADYDLLGNYIIGVDTLGQSNLVMRVTSGESLVLRVTLVGRSRIGTADELALITFGGMIEVV